MPCFTHCISGEVSQPRTPCHVCEGIERYSIHVSTCLDVYFEFDKQLLNMKNKTSAPVLQEARISAGPFQPHVCDQKGGKFHF